MHVARQFGVADFDITIDGVHATREDVFPAWNEWDRLGVVVDKPFGALGANALIQLAATAFYDVKPARREGFPTPEAPRSDLAVYPEIYVFHVGGRHGLYSAYDFWPARKEVFLPAEPRVKCAVLGLFGLRLDDWGGRVYVLRDRKGRSVVVANLGLVRAG